MFNLKRDFVYLVVIAVAAFGIFLACQETQKTSPQFADPHQWLHKELSLTAEQDKKISVIEDGYKQKEKALRDEVRIANKALAEAILKDGRYSENVKQAVAGVHSAMGALQEATLQHLFEMQTVLDEKQAKKLHQLAADALLNAP